jgi:SAM-dependent MidA family methyltransferase
MWMPFSWTTGMVAPVVSWQFARLRHLRAAPAHGQLTPPYRGSGPRYHGFVSTDDFASITESAPLVAELRRRIARAGAISFREFMEAALYHPLHGYYRTNTAVTSRGGDYVTSPEVHPVFGALVARQLAELWELMDRPAPFRVVEAGAGRGLLARDVIGAMERTRPDLSGAIAYTIVEPAPVLERAQRITLAEASLADASVEWMSAMPSAIEGVVLTNELLDAFPVHRVARRGDDLLEVFVTYDGSHFVEELRPPPTPAIHDYFLALGLLPGEGCYAEVNLAARAWIGDVARRLDRGYVLTFDYGYEADALYAPWRKDGTLLCCYRQSMSSDPYQRIGKQDITSSIDFTTLRRAGEEAGLRTLAYTDQSGFLVRMGISEGVTAVAHERPQELEEYFARRNVVMELIDPAGLGRIKVLLQGKGVPEGPFRGFGP